MTRRLINALDMQMSDQDKIIDLSAARVLVARIKCADEPDEQLGAAIWWVLDKARANNAYQAGAMGLPKPAERMPGDFYDLPPGLGRVGVVVSAPKITESLDAALTLCERVLPDCWWSIECELFYDKGTLRPRYIARVREDREAYLHVTTSFAGAAMALCLAVVQAKIRQQKPE